MELASQRCHIVVHGREPSEHIDQTLARLKDRGVEATAIFGDFSQGTDWNEFVASAWGWKGRVDIWVNNAGGDVLTGPWADRTLAEKLAYLIQTDVTSSLMLSRAVGAMMVAENVLGSIINIGWDQAMQGMAGDSGELFATTKGAVMAMTRSLAQSLAPQVRVNCVAPGWIKTQWGEQASDDWQRRAVADSLMRRWGRPEDVASAVAFLASSKSNFITGHTIPVNGGFRHDKSPLKDH